MSAFDRAFDRTIGHEGGYSEDPHDRGGKTKYGISQRAYPNEDIAALTLERAKTLYQRDYWRKIRGDELPEEVALPLFDAAVNHGVKTAIRMMQRAVGVRDDGVIGPRTLEAAHLIEPARFVARFLGDRLMYMTNLATWAHHGQGWSRRVARELRQA